MYQPKGYKLKAAIELAELVSCAYEQFSCFEDNKPWALGAQYELIRELKYSGRVVGSIDRNSKFDDYLERLRELSGKKKVEIPIGFIARKKKDVFLIFRGTKTAKEWINNLNTKLNKFFLVDFGSVHEGFQNSYLDLRDQIEETMKDLRSTRHLFVAGHSLGAAFATFALCDLELSMKRPVSSLYTYGSPRVGDAAFARAFNAAFSKKTFRIANSSDFVTEIPFPVPFANVFGGYFSHVDTPVITTVQHNDIEENHAMRTYLSTLREFREKQNVFARFFSLR